MFIYKYTCHQITDGKDTAQKSKFFITDFFSKCDQIRNFLRLWWHLLKKSVMENFIFCAVGLPEKDHKVFISVRVILEVYSKISEKVCFEFKLPCLPRPSAQNFSLQSMCEKSNTFHILSTATYFVPYFRSKKR